MKRTILLVSLLLGWTISVFAGKTAQLESNAILNLYNTKDLPRGVVPVYSDDEIALAFESAIGTDGLLPTPLFEDQPGEYYLLKVRNADILRSLKEEVPYLQLKNAILIKSTPADAERISHLGWGLTLISQAERNAVLRGPRVPPSITVVDSNIVSLISGITPETAQQPIIELSSLPTRYSYAQACRQAEQHVLDRFGSFGLSASFYEFDYLGTTMRNVIGEKIGVVHPESIVIVCGHIDCISEMPDQLAPGAEDNASGCAAVIEAARILSTRRNDLTVRFVTFSGKEQGLIGSERYASYIQNRGEAIAAVVNVDMIGYSGQYAQDMHVFCDSQSYSLGALSCQALSSYTLLDTISHYDSAPQPGSDHYPFAIRGYSAIFIIDAWDGFDWYPYYHSVADTAGNLNIIQQVEISKAVAALTALLIRPQFGTGYLPGDANGSGTVNGIDVVFMVNCLKGLGPAPNPIYRGDCNGDCLFNGIDVVYLVNYLKGGPAPYSGNCP